MQTSTQTKLSHEIETALGLAGESPQSQALLRLPLAALDEVREQEQTFSDREGREALELLGLYLMLRTFYAERAAR
jgi:hypothetical protein